MRPRRRRSRSPRGRRGDGTRAIRLRTARLPVNRCAGPSTLEALRLVGSGSQPTIRSIASCASAVAFGWVPSSSWTWWASTSTSKSRSRLGSGAFTSRAGSRTPSRRAWWLRGGSAASRAAAITTTRRPGPPRMTLRRPHRAAERARVVAIDGQRPGRRRRCVTLATAAGWDAARARGRPPAELVVDAGVLGDVGAHRRGGPRLRCALRSPRRPRRARARSGFHLLPPLDGWARRADEAAPSTPDAPRGPRRTSSARSACGGVGRRRAGPGAGTDRVPARERGGVRGRRGRGLGERRRRGLTLG